MIHKNGNRNYNQKTSDKQKPRARCLHKFYQILSKELKPVLKLFRKIAEGGTLPNSFCKTAITLITKPVKNIIKKRILQVNITDEYTCKNLEKILANRKQQ